MIDAPLFLIGGGALLTKAVARSLDAGVDVALVHCPVDDPAIPKLRRMDVAFCPGGDPNADMAAHLAGRDDAVVFSINNAFVLGDALLAAGPRFYNIHSGLVQVYRGIAEVCVLAAICHGVAEYGVTLHRILPAQGVDCGPVVTQRAFPVDRGEARFADVMGACLSACDAIFGDNLATVIRGANVETSVTPSDAPYLYRDVPRIRAAASPDAWRRASDLGSYAPFFPRLSAAIARGAG